MQRSESITELAKALAKAQGAIQNASKEVKNTFFDSKYADLASIRDAMRQPFADNGLSVPQFVSTTEPTHMGQHEEFDKKLGKAVQVEDYISYVVVETLLLHSSGEWMSSELRLPVWNPDAQSIGSASTYGRRYAMQSVAAIAAEIDDDGNAASGRNAERQEPRREPPQPPKQPSPAKPPAARAEPAKGNGADNGGWVAGENTERMERKSSPPPNVVAIRPEPVVVPDQPRDPAVGLQIRQVMKKLMARNPDRYPNAAACEQRCVDATGQSSKLLNFNSDQVFLASLEAELAAPNG